MRITKRSSSVVLVFASLAASSCKLPVDFERTSAQIPACSAEADAAFDRIVKDFLEVDATTPDFMELGVGNAERGGGWAPHTDIWHPVTGFKAPVAGTLQRMVWFTDEDFDWGIDVGVAPTSSSKERLDEATERFGAVQFGNGKLPRIHCEVAPEKSFPDRSGFWFTQLAIMDDGKMGAFGPWVGDQNPSHDDETAIPELHPAELTWWRQTTGPRDSIFWLLVMQDSINQYNRDESYYDSGHRNRFRRREYFDFDDRPEPAGWTEWAKGPIHAQYRIAFEVLANEPAAQFWIVPQVKLSVQPALAPDMDDGATHRLIVDGREILKAVEVADPKDTAVRVADLCKTADGAIRGFLEVATWTGVEGPDTASGYHFLAVIRNGGVPRQLRDRKITKPPTLDLEKKEEKPKFEAWLEVAPTLRTDAVTCAWYQVAQTLEQPDLPPPPANLLHSISAWDVSANFEVGPEEAGRAHLEDATPEQQLASREALATAKVEWDVKLTCFDANAKIATREDDGSGAAGASGASAGPAIVVTKRAAKTPQESLHIAIPPEYASHLIHAAITATVKDARGRVAKTTKDLWSCALAADRELLPHEVGRWLGIAAAERGPSALRACLFDGCADGVLTLPELRSLLRAKAKRSPTQ